MCSIYAEYNNKQKMLKTQDEQNIGFLKLESHERSIFTHVFTCRLLEAFFKLIRCMRRKCRTVLNNNPNVTTGLTSCAALNQTAKLQFIYTNGLTNYIKIKYISILKNLRCRTLNKIKIWLFLQSSFPIKN
jgi:hypothetical protein